MYVNVGHLKPGMELESDVRLKAGSYLITRKELQSGKLTEPVIDSIQKFSAQLAPLPNLVSIKADTGAFESIQLILRKDVEAMISTIEAGNEYPNFLPDGEVKEKVYRVMERLISNPEMIQAMYELKSEMAPSGSVKQQLLDHCIRVTMLSIALGLQIRCSIVSLINLGMAGILHDMGILKHEIFPQLNKLDDMLPKEIEAFVGEHQKLSRQIFESSQMSLLPFTRQVIIDMIEHHHRPDQADLKHKTTMLLYFAELVDEMISPLPSKVRYNFTEEQLRRIGDRFRSRVGLINLLLALIKLFQKSEAEWEIVAALVRLFSMQELLVEGYDEKIREILNASIYKSAVAYPHLGGNAIPRTIYCNSSLEPEFNCEYLTQVRIEIVQGGKTKSYFKCGKLTDMLHSLNIAGRDESESQKKKKDDKPQTRSSGAACNPAEPDPVEGKRLCGPVDRENAGGSS